MSEIEKFSERLRLRTDDELDLQNKGLQEISELLDGLNIVHYLSSGTLLGAIREENFIRWDWDVQFYFKTEDVLDRYDEIIECFKLNGFNPVKVNPSKKNYKILVDKYNTTYEMTAWEDFGIERRRSEWKLPAKFFSSESKISFLGKDYFYMYPAEEYLEYCYGKDWRTPRRIDDKSEYLAENFYKKPKWQRNATKNIKNVLRTVKRKILGY